ncbi:MAG: DUF362 domain-containing protein [Bacteroidia bacterium]|nr:DUF362 domain-containing protein [Bacteroidia bacterium]
MKRRDFLAGVTTAAAAGVLFPRTGWGRRTPAPSHLQPHPFVEAHPESVFIRRTNVGDKLDTNAKRAEGLSFAREYFTGHESTGIPFSHALAVKPNLTCTTGTGNTPEGMGIITDIDFMDGLFGGIRETGFPGYNMFAREANWMANGYCTGEYLVTGQRMQAVTAKHGMHLFDFPSGRNIYDMRFQDLQTGTEVIWRDVPDGVMFNRIGFLAPCNDEQSWLLNIAKFKTHGMGMTLCTKNLQGMVVAPLVHFCEGLEATKNRSGAERSVFHADIEQRVTEAYARHRAAGIPRWDRPETDGMGGLGMETWAHRTLDSIRVTNVGLNIIEGIYGRNGNGFTKGPGPNDTPQDFMSNVLIFGKDPLLVDVVGTWLAGHEPGNFGLFHLARERGLLGQMDPRRIPVYDWNGGTPQLAVLEEMPRTPLVCPYLRRNYDGQSEEYYHLVNEPFDYSTLSAAPAAGLPLHVHIKALTNPVRDSALIEYTLPRAGNAHIDLYDIRGSRVASFSEGWKAEGTHTLRWHTGHLPAGLYIARIASVSGNAHCRVTLLR